MSTLFDPPYDPLDHDPDEEREPWQAPPVPDCEACAEPMMWQDDLWECPKCGHRQTG